MLASELARYLHPDCYLPDLKSTTKNEVIEELIEPLIETGILKNSNLVLETLKKRETLGSTGIGKGVAIPHCRTLAVSKIHIVCGVSRKGIEYDATDKKKVNLIFLILAPPNDEANRYLPILGTLVERIRDSKTRQALIGAKDYADFVQVIGG
jgi:fructose-specific phosphotransferase system IIA component